MPRIEGFPFDEAKATQVAALLIHRSGGRINHLLLTKLLYIIDRESFRKWARPVVGGSYASLPHGPVISPALDLARSSEARIAGSFWMEHIQKSGNEISLRQDPGANKLSQEELGLVDLVFAKYGHWSPWDVRNLTHAEFAEWQDPGASSLPISIEDILKAIGKSSSEIENVANDINHLSFVRRIFSKES